LKIEKLKIYDLKESIIASGYPMMTDTNEYDFIKKFRTARKLGSTQKGEGHDQFLTGIRVNFDLTFTNKEWVELERYRFVEFVSSQSTMHRIANFNLKNQYNEYVDFRMIDIMEELKKQYNITKSKEDYLKLLYSNPSGFELTARLTTNYRALKNVITQRYNHRLPNWRDFCDYMLSNLPYFRELTGIELERK